MTLQDRDKRALLILAGVVGIGGIWWVAASGDAKAPVSPDSVPLAEKRLDALRKTAATVPGKQAVLKQVSAELAKKEKGLIQADTAPQAQAQLLQVLRQVAHAQQPPLEIRQYELGQPKPFGDSYGEVSVAISLDCQIDQLVNFMADLTAQPELIATSDLHVGSAHAKQKTMPVRLQVSALVPRKLAPKKTGIL